MISTPRNAPTVRLRTTVIKIADDPFGKIVTVRAVDALTVHELTIDNSTDSGKAFIARVKIGAGVDLTATLRV